KYGTGGDYQRVAQAVTAALQGLAGGDIGSALAGASAPYLAQLIKKTTGDNAALNTMAHAVLGAAVAQAQGNSAIAGAAGAAGGELAARLITQQLYGTRDTNTLSEEQKQTVSALATLAAGLAGGIAKGDSAGAIAGAGAGKNAVENNLLANKYGVEKLNETSLVALHEKLVAAKIGGMNDLQEKFSACAGDGGCERAVRNEYRQREKESGENLVALYQAGGLSQEDLNLLFGKYARIMMEGAKEGQLNSGWGGILGSIYTLNGNDWTPIGTISNPYLAIVRSSEQISEWKKQGLSDEKIRELSLKDGVISSVLAPVDVNGVTNLLNNGASKEELVQFAMIAAFGRVASGSGKLSKVTDGSGGSAGQAVKDTKVTPTEQLALPSPEFNVPGEYRLIRNADGTATVEGPRGGLYNSTGRYTTDGKPVFRDNSGGYVTLDGGRVNVSAPVNYESIPIHHICTNKCTSGANGQIAWTKEYQRFFDGADLNINRATENLVAVPGHRGPHPIEYHQYVYGSLEQATQGLVPRTPAYKEAVTKTLDGIKKEALTVGSDVNKWLTRN
ncbi:AHH domain-containing protein, partial [Pseudomonas sp. PH1b]|uniref:AHH domain-containing protein n=1 Tax=Pseudomonas sp. PH1b TaxID=1397282 RepID=UPI0005B9FE46